MNYLELARVGRADFIEMLRRFPVLRRRLVEQSLASFRSDSEVNPLMAEYVEQGLYEGQSILVLDMDLCTRCDECTKGCIREHGDESHGVPITRLLRDGRVSVIISSRFHVAPAPIRIACRVVRSIRFIAANICRS